MFTNEILSIIKSINKEGVVKLKFQRKVKIILICVCLLCLISIPLVSLRVLPFIIFPITTLVTFVIVVYILFKWFNSKKGSNK